MNIDVINNNLRMKTVLPQRKNENSADVCRQDEVKTHLIKAHQALSFGYAVDPTVIRKLMQNTNPEMRNSDDAEQVEQAFDLLKRVDTTGEIMAIWDSILECNPVLTSEAILQCINGDEDEGVKAKAIGAAGYLHETFDDDQKKALIEAIEPLLDSADLLLLTPTVSTLGLLSKRKDRSVARKRERRIAKKFRRILKDIGYRNIPKYLAYRNLLKFTILAIGNIGNINDAESLLPYMDCKSPVQELASNNFCKLVPLEGFSLETGYPDSYLEGKLDMTLAHSNNVILEKDISSLKKSYDANKIANQLIPHLTSDNESKQGKALKAAGILASELSPSYRKKLKLYIYRIIIDPGLQPEALSEALTAIARLTEPNDKVSIRFFDDFMRSGLNLITEAAAKAIGIVGNRTHAELLRPHTRGKSARAKHIKEIYDALKKKPAPGDGK